MPFKKKRIAIVKYGSKGYNLTGFLRGLKSPFKITIPHSCPVPLSISPFSKLPSLFYKLVQSLGYRAFSLSPGNPENTLLLVKYDSIPPYTLILLQDFITHSHTLIIRPSTRNKTIQICGQKNSKIFGGWLLEMFFLIFWRITGYFSGPLGQLKIPCSIDVATPHLLAVCWFFPLKKPIEKHPEFPSLFHCFWLTNALI